MHPAKIELHQYFDKKCCRPKTCTSKAAEHFWKAGGLKSQPAHTCCPRNGQQYSNCQNS